MSAEPSLRDVHLKLDWAEEHIRRLEQEIATYKRARTHTARIVPVPGALKTDAGETYPHLFAAVVATSPAVWPTYQDMMNGPHDVFDGATDFAAHDVIGHAQRLAGTPLLVECGTADPFHPFVRELCDRLPSGDHYRFSFGGHNYAYWRTLEPAALEFTARHLGAARA